MIQTLPEEDFTLQNYLKAKNRLPTPPLPPSSLPIEEQPTAVVSSEDKQEPEREEIQVHDEQIDNYLPINENNFESSDFDFHDQPPPIYDSNNDQNHSPSITPYYDQQLSFDPYQHGFPHPTPNNISTTPSFFSSAVAADQPIRIEISEKAKPFIPVSSNVPQTRKEMPLPAPPLSFFQPPRSRKPPTQLSAEFSNRTPIKITVSDQTTGKR